MLTGREQVLHRPRRFPDRVMAEVESHEPMKASHSAYPTWLSSKSQSFASCWGILQSSNVRKWHLQAETAKSFVSEAGIWPDQAVVARFLLQGSRSGQTWSQPDGVHFVGVAVSCQLAQAHFQQFAPKDELNRRGLGSIWAKVRCGGKFWTFGRSPDWLQHIEGLLFRASPRHGRWQMKPSKRSRELQKLPRPGCCLLAQLDSGVRTV